MNVLVLGLGNTLLADDGVGVMWSATSPGPPKPRHICTRSMAER